MVFSLLYFEACPGNRCTDAVPFFGSDRTDRINLQDAESEWGILYQRRRLRIVHLPVSQREFASDEG